MTDEEIIYKALSKFYAYTLLEILITYQIRDTYSPERIAKDEDGRFNRYRNANDMMFEITQHFQRHNLPQPMLFKNFWLDLTTQKSELTHVITEVNKSYDNMPHTMSLTEEQRKALALELLQKEEQRKIEQAERIEKMKTQLLASRREQMFLTKQHPD